MVSSARAASTARPAQAWLALTKSKVSAGGLNMCCFHYIDGAICGMRSCERGNVAKQRRVRRTSGSVRGADVS